MTTSGETHWVLIVLALIGAVSAIGAAWASNASRSSTKKLDATNTAQHADTTVQLKQVYDRQQWMIDQLAELRQALLEHVMWEQGGHAHPEPGDGKYFQIERQIAELEAQLHKEP